MEFPLENGVKLKMDRDMEFPLENGSRLLQNKFIYLSFNLK